MDSSRDCVLLFVGSFSPPTVGHIGALSLARDALRARGFNVIRGVMVPTHCGYGKPSLASNEDRLEMCRLAAATTDFVEVDDFEVRQEHWTRTIDTTEHVQSRFPGARVILVFGIDIVASFEAHWRKPDVLRFLDEYGMVILSRGGKNIDDITKVCPWFEGRLKNVTIVQDNPLTRVSSTSIRERFADGNGVSEYLAPAVERYIRDHGLYHQASVL